MTGIYQTYKFKRTVKYVQFCSYFNDATQFLGVVDEKCTILHTQLKNIQSTSVFNQGLHDMHLMNN